MKMILPVMSALCALTLVGCQTMGAALNSNQYEYDLQRQCPSVLEMKVGETLHFKVDENITTGYQWQLLQPLKNLKVEESYITQKQHPMIVGAGGEKIFRFTATQAGDDVIEMIHERGWQTAHAEVQWQCKIHVSAS